MELKRGMQLKQGMEKGFIIDDVNNKYLVIWEGINNKVFEYDKKHILENFEVIK